VTEQAKDKCRCQQQNKKNNDKKINKEQQSKDNVTPNN